MNFLAITSSNIFLTLPHLSFWHSYVRKFNTVLLAIEVLFTFCNFCPFFRLTNFYWSSSSPTCTFAIPNLFNPFSEIFISNMVLLSSRMPILFYSFHFSTGITHLFSIIRILPENITIALKSNSAGIRVCYHLGEMVLTLSPSWFFHVW